ncbi:MAG: type 4a pilus biogenesis protein PilO [Terriglobia bacterium]
MASKKFSDLPPGQQGLILAALPVILAAVVFYDMVSPISRKATALKAQLTTLEAQNVRGKLLEAQRANLMRHIADANKELDTLRQIVPDQAADDQFIRMVSDDAAESQVHLRSVTTEPPVRQQFFTAMPFRVRMDGTYYGMLAFFSRLAGSPRIVNVSGLTLGAPASGGEGAYRIAPDETVGADCVLTTFYNSPPLPPPPPPRRGFLRR